MIRKTVVFEENLHHTCLTFGLKHSFEKMPFLNRKTLNIKGNNRLIDNIVSLPPMMRKIEKSLIKEKIAILLRFLISKTNLVLSLTKSFAIKKKFLLF